ncbi:TPA: damage-inducible type I toxin DinQ [Escherichia coli]
MIDKAIIVLGALISLLGVSLDIENYCTLRLLFNQSLVLDKVPEYGKPAKCCSP